MTDDVTNVPSPPADPDTSNWDEQRAVTGRPNDVPPPNSTFADRVKMHRKPVEKSTPDSATPVTAPKRARKAT